MEIKKNIKNKTLGNYTNLVATLLYLVTFILYLATSHSVKFTIILFLLLAFISGFLYTFVDYYLLEISNFLAVVFATIALVQVAISSIATFADVINGISMFGSSGGLTFIILILVILGIGILVEIISCFSKREKA